MVSNHHRCSSNKLFLKVGSLLESVFCRLVIDSMFNPDL